MLHSVTATLHHYRGGSFDLSPYISAYSEQHSIKTFPVFSFTAPARINNTPIQSIIEKGDILEISLRNGKRQATTFIGPVRGETSQTILTSSGHEDTIIYTGSSLSGYLMSSVFNWYTLIGGFSGKYGTLAQIPADMVLLKRLDESIKNILELALFKIIGLETPLGNTEDLLGYALHSLEAMGHFEIQLASYESTGWKMLEAYAERPLHELYSRFVPESDLGLFNGEKRSGKTFGGDNASEVIVLRPAPFPSFDGSSSDVSAWNALPMHDLGQLAPQSFNLSSNDQNVINFTHLTSKGLLNDSEPDVLISPPIVNITSRKRFGHKAIGWQTFLSNRDAHKEDMIEFFSRLNFRLASQHNRLEGSEQGTIPLGLEPTIHVGERIRFKRKSDSQFYQGYVVGVNHNVAASSATTTLAVDRVFPESVYANPSYFAEGLEELVSLGGTIISEDEVRKYDEPGPTRY
jgi:hypothetical protein